MRKISNYKNKKLREDQFKVLFDVLWEAKNKEDFKLILEIFVTESETAYLGQRLNIMRMLIKNFTYQQIQDQLDVPSSTISSAKIRLDIGGERLKSILSSYKYKPQRKIGGQPSNGNGLVSPKTPGAIRFKK